MLKTQELNGGDEKIRACDPLRGWQPGGQRCPILVTEASIAEALSCQLGGNGSGVTRESHYGFVEHGE